MIEKFFSKKRNVVGTFIFLIIIVSLGTYVLTGIQKNVLEMAEPPEAVTYFPDYPSPNLTGKDPALIKRGEYLAKAGDCMACHTNTAQKGKAFAGGLAMQTPFGTLFTPNITPDKETGIGNWTDEQFIKAMREGISPEGKYYYPAFPYLYFNKITTDDLKAIKAYLDSLPAIQQSNLPNKMIWPFNWRFLQLGWRLLFFNPVATGPFQSNPQQSSAWNQGAYLVEGLGHCAMCHTPSYYMFSEKLPLGAPIQKYNLTGAKIQGYLAPNITQENLANVPDEEVIKVFSHNQLIGGGNVEGPMLEVNQDSLRYLSHADLLAMVTYLKSVRSETPPRPKGSIGKSVYENYCSGCHATGAGGAPRYGDAYTWTPILKNGIDPVYTHAIKGIGGMPAKGTCISCQDSDIKQAVDYMVAAVAGKKGSAAPAAKKLTLEDGKRIYQSNCSVCHDAGFKKAPKPGDIDTWRPIVNAGFIAAYTNVETGINGHPPHGACPTCTDAELIAAIKYMMTVSSTSKNFELW